jgi:REP element-mobilizing transposase RayT
MRRSKQQALDLGRDTVSRDRGGRPEGPNPRVRHRSRKPFLESQPSLVTLKAVRGLPSLRKRRIVRAIEAAFRAAKERPGFRLVHYSIQRDHVHLIVEAGDRAALGRAMKSLGTRFALAVNRALGRTGRVLAERYHQRILACPRQVRNALAYVLMNARHHAAQQIARWRAVGRNADSLPNAGTLDGASSARWFEGWRTGVAADRSPPCSLGTAPAVAEPRTWFLRLGWQRFGLLDPNEIPGELAR